MSYPLKPEFYPGRQDWSEYSFHHSINGAMYYNINSTTSMVKRITLSNPKFPEIKIGENVVDRVAVVVNSSLRLSDSFGFQRRI